VEYSRRLRGWRRARMELSLRNRYLCVRARADIEHKHKSRRQCTSSYRANSETRRQRIWPHRHRVRFRLRQERVSVGHRRIGLSLDLLPVVDPEGPRATLPLDFSATLRRERSHFPPPAGTTPRTTSWPKAALTNPCRVPSPPAANNSFAPLAIAFSA